ncbi:TonB-dependent receptor [Pectobacterium punjabense]|uniref:TonB-dependent receptor n=1 Tax=Pectobacterium punjabense TaxID=2108399 RepID=UPI00196995BF|nr:TonB-dependent receptor [Pectobacterium punjabense]MBN3136978.1 TonB-dependent receptor [Pectobacterium punjabense]MBT9182588.1 TonB-dependent receptor [Pectobacterium punjabense]MCE5379197.1 TonB-dependent receptor [Pectobacterium punjabense]
MKGNSLINLKNAVALALAATAANAAMAADNNDVLVVTASGYEKKLTNAPASISVVSEEELSQKSYHDLGEALSGVEGVDVRSGTGKTGGLDISIRGMPSSYTLILIDGVRQNASGDATPNGFDTMNTAVMPPLSAIERIEVIRGPMSTLYGSDAIGGVVNIITKKDSKQWRGSVNLSHTVQEHRKWGDSSTLGFYTSGPLVNDQFSLALRGNVEHRQASSVTSLNSNGGDTRIPFPTKTDNYNVGGKLSFKTSDVNTLWVDGDVSRQTYDNSYSQLGPIGVTGGGYRDELRFERNKLAIGHDTDLSFGRWSSNLSYTMTENKGRLLTPRVLIPANATLSGRDRELKNTNTIFDTMLVSPVGDDHLLTVGGQFWDARLKDGIVLANSGETFEQKSWSLYAEDDWQLLEPLSLTLGARYEKHDSFGGHLSPRAYLVWNVADDWTVKGGVSTGYKTPSLAQLHNGVSGIGGNGTTSTIGNPNLKPEESTNFETGVYYENAANVKANITGFVNHYKNAIDSVEISNSSIGTYRNIGKARTQGVELATSFPVFVPDVTLALNYTYTHSEQIGGNNPGAALTTTAKHMANARLNWQIDEQWNSWLAAEYRANTPRFTNNYANLNDAQKLVYDARGADLKSWTVVNLGTSYKVTKDVTLNGTVNNLLDKDFSQVQRYTSGRNTYYAGDYFGSSSFTTGYVMPGRNYWMSVNVTF